jgi:hypothetical protein
VLIVAFSWGDLWRLALAAFLFAVGATLAFLLVRLGETAGRLSSLVKGMETDLLPVVTKLGGSVDRVNGQLDKVDRITDSAVDAVDSADTAIRAVSMAITRPIQKATGFAAGVSHAFADFRTRRDLRGAVQAGREAAARREQEFTEELREAGRG